MINKIKSMIKEIFKQAIYLVGYQIKIDWKKRYEEMGEMAVYNSNLSRNSAVTNTELLKNIYINILRKYTWENNPVYILDYGCGVGRFGDIFKRALSSKSTVVLTGYDPCPPFLNHILKDSPYQFLSSSLEEVMARKYDLIFVHMVLGGLVKEEASETISCLLKRIVTNGKIFIVDVVNNEKVIEYNSWKERDISFYTPEIEGIEWEVCNTFYEAGDSLVTIVGHQKN